ncbi:Ig-like domain-containing protein [Pararcticibacter amylolyticus]|uniref:Fibronectin type-III domain-containing protein n=1 Tax=Pararcticibacter amylolyticus TaxID=2173175 RepID=A0A2U2PB04_9SPHI|nr:Ig-like domain-containing protein [Pararcticibacter amylolyticus]PWG78578.1 hypothetical protein DDR33_21690 [Pararcticibacter amylolyticus]
MKINFTRIAIAIVFYTFCGVVNAQTWQTLGKAENIDDQVSPMSVSASMMTRSADGTLYAVMDEYNGTGSGARPTVKKYINNKWVAVGQERFGSTPSGSSRMAFAPDGTIYVSAVNVTTRKCTVYKLSGSLWVVAGNEDFATCSTPSRIAVDANGVPYVIYRENVSYGRCMIMKLNGSTWEISAVLSATITNSSNMDLVRDASGVLFAAFRDDNQGSKATVMKLDNGAWKVVGTEGFTSSSVNALRLVFDSNNIPYLLSDAGGKLGLMKFVSGSWQTHSANISTGTIGADLDMTFDASGNIYVAYANVPTSNKTVVKKFSGGQWQSLGNANGFSGGGSPNVGLGLYNGNVYVLYRDNAYGGKPIFSKFNGTDWDVLVYTDDIESTNSPTVVIDNTGTVYAVFQDEIKSYTLSAKKFVNGSWQFVGARGFSSTSPSLGMQVAVGNNNKLYVAYRQATTGVSRIQVWQYDGTAWSALSDPGTGGGSGDYYVDIAVDKDGVPYVSYSDTNEQIIVKKYTGGSWVLVGSTVSDGNGYSNSLAFDPSGIPYVVYADASVSINKLSVKRFVNGAWEYVGIKGFSENYANAPDLVFGADGTPFIGYAASSKLYIKKYEGGNWKTVGPEVGIGSVAYPRLAVDADGTLYIAYKHSSNGLPMASRFFNGAWVPAPGTPASILTTNGPSLFYRNNIVAMAHGLRGGFVKTMSTLKNTGTPANLRVTEGDRKLSLQWDAVSQATDYKLYSMDANGNSTLVTQITGTQYVHPNLTFGTVYRYRVAALNGTEEGIFSAEVSAIPFGGSVTCSAALVNTQTVTLNIAASDAAAKMSFSNDGNTWSEWEDYAATKSWTVTAGDGAKTIYMKLKNSTIESGVYSTTLTLDQTPVTVSGVEEGQLYNTDRTIILSTFKTATLTNNVTSQTSSISSPYLVSGEGSFKIVAEDNAGNRTEVNFYIDKTAPLSAATIAMAGRNEAGYTRELRPVVNGTGEADGKVKLYLDGSSAAMAQVDVSSSGTWSYTFGTDLAEKAYTVKSVISDRAGNAGPESAAFAFTVDKTAPSAPVVEAATWGRVVGYTPKAKPVISGTAEANSKVSLYQNGSPAPLADVTASGTGAWSYTPATPLAEASHFFTATATDQAGNVSVLSAALSVTVDFTAPDVPVISSVTGRNGNGYTRESKPAIGGTVEVGSYVAIYLNGSAAKYGGVAAKADGTWSYTGAADLAEGEYFITAGASDPAGNSSTLTVPFNFVVDKTAPAAPVISGVSGRNSAGYTRQSKPAVSGTTEANAIVSLYLDGSSTKLADVTANTDGVWSYTFGSDLDERAHSVTAKATDLAGNAGAGSAAFSFIVDKTAPVTTITSLSGLNNGFTKEIRPTVSGTTEANAKVSLFLDGSTTRLADVTAGAGGEWSYTFTAGLSAGPRSLKASAVDLAGNTGTLSAPFNFTVDKTAPVTTITSLSGLDNGFVRESRPTVSGSSEAHARISLYLDGSALLQAEITADASGKWTYTFTTDLARGTRSLKASGTDQAGNAGALSAALSFTVDRTAPAAPRIITVAGRNSGAYIKTGKPEVAGTAEENSTLGIFVDGSTVQTASLATPATGVWYYTFTTELPEGEHTLIAVATDKAGNTSPASTPFKLVVDKTAPATTITAISGQNERGYTAQLKPTVSGTTEPNTPVSLYLDAGMTKLGEVSSDGSGNWQYTFVSPLSEAEHKIWAAATDKAGNTATIMATLAFKVDVTAPKAPRFNLYANAAGYYNGQRPFVTGTVEPGTRLRLLVKDHPELSSDFPSSMGQVTDAIFPRELPEGTYTFTAAAVDEADNISPLSESRTIIIDVTAPSAPVISSLSGLNEAGYTSQQKPLISGTTEAHASVSLYLDGSTAKLATIKAEANGRWSYPFPMTLPEGSHSITAKATDLADNTGTVSAAFRFTVDATIRQPQISRISGQTPFGHTNQIRPVISGTADKDAVISIHLDGIEEASTVTADAGGIWEFTFPHALAESAHELKVTAKDAAGNESQSSAQSFTVDATAPEAPVLSEIPGGTGLTADPSARTKGKSEPGAIVEIYAGSHKADEVVAGEDGTWMVSFDPVLAVGSHEITAIAVDKAGNRSQPGTPATIRVISQKINTVLETGTIEAKTYGDQDFTLAAVSNNDQSPVRYSSSNSRVLSVSENGTVHIAGAGTASITLTQAASPAFTSSTIIREIVVNKARHTVHYTPVPALERHGEPFGLQAYASSGLPVQVKSSNPMVVKVKEGKLEPQGIGRATVTLSVADTSNYQAVQVDIDVTVADQSGEKVIVGKVLSPNGDGINDVLKIEGLTSLGRHRILIFNREGTPVFKTDFYPSGEVSEEGTKGFTGSFKVNSLPQGTYFYKVEYLDGNVQKQKTGFVVVKY